MADDEKPWEHFAKAKQAAQQTQPPKPITDLPGNIVRSAGAFGQQIWDAAKGMVVDEEGNPISFEKPLGRTPTGILNTALGTAQLMSGSGAQQTGSQYTQY